jgi:rhodanese-related sulfurtransferase
MRRLLRALLLVAPLLLFAACVAAPEAAAPERGFATVGVAELKDRLDRGEPLLVLDVRSPEEYAQDGHLAGSMLIPLPELPQRMGELEKDGPIVCFCRSGNRSLAACTQLAEAGFTNLVNIDGGIGAWRAAGYPVE